jgi:endogenous inhibitor of DNA gyrase (YacG/DUF329 family)
MEKVICPTCGTEMDLKEEEKYGGQKWIYVEYCPKCDKD